MRRWSGLAVSALLALSLLAVPVTAFADDAAAGPSTDAVVLAADAGEDLGPDPQPRDAEDNPARTESGYEDRPTPFTWGAAWILTVAGGIGVVLLVGLYELLVRRPAQRTSH